MRHVGRVPNRQIPQVSGWVGRWAYVCVRVVGGGGIVHVHVYVQQRRSMHACLYVSVG